MSLLKRIERNQQPSGSSEGGSASKMRELRVRRQSASASRDAHSDIKTRVQNQLIAELDPKMDMSRTDEVRGTIEELFDQILAEENLVLSRAERQRLFETIVAEILGYGPIEPLLADDSVTEIMVNGAKQIYVERSGKLQRTNLVF